MPQSHAEVASRVRENLARVRETIAAAATRSGRTAESVMLVGVTKYVDPEIARRLVEAGLTDLGESRPQELWRKAEMLGDLKVSWHLIGHLQRNKVKRTVPLTHLIHSGDSLRLLQEIDKEAAAQNLVANVLLEANVSGDASKTGLKPDEIEPLFPELSILKHLQMRGLMTMASLEGGPDQARRDFESLRKLRDKLQGVCPPGVGMIELSMGMSGDYEVAIEEGATIVRVGSALLEGLES